MYVIYIYIIIIINMALQPYMGLGLLFPRLRGLRICGSSETSRLVALYNSILMWQPEPSGRAFRRLGWEMAVKFCLRNIFIHARRVLLHAVNLRHGTDGFTSPPKEVVLRNFIALKNPSTSVGIEPVASTLTTSPPRSTFICISRWQHIWT
jgi:hypothetical protein